MAIVVPRSGERASATPSVIAHAAVTVASTAVIDNSVTLAGLAAQQDGEDHFNAHRSTGRSASHPLGRHLIGRDCRLRAGHCRNRMRSWDFHPEPLKGGRKWRQKALLYRQGADPYLTWHPAASPRSSCSAGNRGQRDDVRGNRTPRHRNDFPSASATATKSPMCYAAKSRSRLATRLRLEAPAPVRFFRAASRTPGKMPAPRPGGFCSCTPRPRRAGSSRSC
jgi:hypothetical protein